MYSLTATLEWDQCVLLLVLLRNQRVDFGQFELSECLLECLVIETVLY